MTGAKKKPRKKLKSAAYITVRQTKVTDKTDGALRQPRVAQSMPSLAGHAHLAHTTGDSLDSRQNQIFFQPMLSLLLRGTLRLISACLGVKALL